MIGPSGRPLMVYLATRPVDFRKGHDGLSAFVRDMFGLNPFSGAVFVFRSKRADRIEDPGLGSDRAGAGAQAARGRQVRLARGARRRHALVARTVRGVVRRARLAACSTRARAPSRTGGMTATN